MQYDRQQRKGGAEMATKSVLKNVLIKNRRSAHALVRALENASGKQSQNVSMSRTCKELDKNDVQKMFGGNDGRV